MRLIVLLCALFMGQVLFAADAYQAKAYPQDSDKAKTLFQLEFKTIETAPTGEEVVSLEYKDAEQKLLHSEKGWIKGLEISKVEVEQHQMGVKAEVQVKEGKIFFTKKMKDGSKKESDEKLKGDFVMAPTFQKYIQSKFSALVKGEEFDIRYGVWDRLETVGFTIFKKKEETKDGKALIQVIMKPTSFVIAALVKPIVFLYEKETGKLVEMNGRVPVKKVEGESFKDLDALVIYE